MESSLDPPSVLRLGWGLTASPTPFPRLSAILRLCRLTGFASETLSRLTTSTLDRAKALDEGVFRAEQEAAASLGRVHILDLSDLFCDGAACPPVKNGIIVYRDNSHISALFAQSLAPEISRRLIPLLPDAN